ncbi:MAG: hypothetical protein Q9164_002343 [Protoblastenia rupestris]
MILTTCPAIQWCGFSSLKPSLAFTLTPDMQAYGINRTEHDPKGYHERRYSSVERHLKAAPPAVKRGKRYPKEHLNKEGHYSTNTKLYEYPTMDYPYSEQNAKGQVRRQSPGGHVTYVSPGYTRTIVDANKQIHGVSYHPHGNFTSFERAHEIRPKKSRRS